MLPKLEVGSGNSPTPGFMHSDVDARMPELDYVCSMEAIPVMDESFSEVRSVHSIEHVPIRKARAALKEWHRVLAPGGRLYIDTPNIERNAMLYLRGTWREDFNILTPEQQDECSIGGVPNRGLWLNFKVFSDDDTRTAWNLHRWNADPLLLRDMLMEAGFTDVDVVQISPSLIVEAYKL